MTKAPSLHVIFVFGGISISPFNVVCNLVNIMNRARILPTLPPNYVNQRRSHYVNKYDRNTFRS